MIKVIFYGPLGKPNTKVVGGGESGNIKTISVLEQNGINVYMLRKPYCCRSIISKLFYVFKLFFILLVLFSKLILNKRISIVHISGFYKFLIYQEFLLILISKLFRRKCIYELRAGGLLESYNEGSALYKFFLSKSVLYCDVILVQGERYVDFLNLLGAKEIVHYPNYIMGNIKQRTKDILEDGGLIKLTFFGRLSPSKNILFMLEVCKVLKDKGIIYSLDLIGEGDSEYINLINKQIIDYKLSDRIKLYPPMYNNDLVEKIKSMHFFLFPTKEPREGHSNSLTEAMSLGLVPICSDYGFNSEIVSQDNLVLNIFDPELYADRIVDIIKNNLWSNYSKLMQQIVTVKFTSEIVEKKLLAIYNLES